MQFSRVLIFLTLGLTVPACAENTTDWIEKIKLPPGFKISIFSDRTPNARSLALGEDGTVYVGTMNEGKVYALRDEDNNGKAESVYTIATGLNMPNGIAYMRGDLYVAENHRIVKLKDITHHLKEPPNPEVIYDGLPKERHHGWRYLRLGPDGKLYISIGAPCNICLSTDERFASISRLDPDGKNFEIYARGIRNSLGFDWQPKTGALYFTDNGRDMLGDDSPAEELNSASKAGLHYGYPFCHGGDISDPEFGGQRSCTEFSPPAWKFPAHVAPLGIHFYIGNLFPAEYLDQLFVVQHGSWNRTTPHGYRVSLVKFKDGKPYSDEIFAEGWLQGSEKAIGRPVDVLELKSGSLLVSDDLRGVIYLITYAKETL